MTRLRPLQEGLTFRVCPWHGATVHADSLLRAPIRMNAPPIPPTPSHR